MQWSVMEMLTLQVLSSVSGHPSLKAGCKTHIPKPTLRAGKPFYTLNLSNPDAGEVPPSSWL